jgi:XTP/dITP diphosphohydrolase
MIENTSFSRLQEILDDLREKCPWDKKQTIHSLRQLTIEETYELADAIASDDWKGIKEELGDLLLHILFYAKIATEQNQFTIQDVIEESKSKALPEEFIAGLQCAQALTLDITSHEVDKTLQEELF